MGSNLNAEQAARLTEAAVIALSDLLKYGSTTALKLDAVRLALQLLTK